MKIRTALQFILAACVSTANAAEAQTTSISPRAEADLFTPSTSSGQALRLAQGERVGAREASGQAYPGRPIRVIVPGSAGSANDFTARAIAQRFTDAWGQQIVIDNRSGAGGIIAHELAAKAAPDGYTLIFSTSAGLIINPLLYKVPYDSMRKESERWGRVIKAADLRIER